MQDQVQTLKSQEPERLFPLTPEAVRHLLSSHETQGTVALTAPPARDREK